MVQRGSVPGSHKRIRLGNAARYISTLRSPGYHNWDLAIQKYWHFSDAMRLQFRAEMFNAFNHPQLYAPNQYLGNRVTNQDGSYGGAFGQISGAFPARDIQFATKFYW